MSVDRLLKKGWRQGIGLLLIALAPIAVAESSIRVTDAFIRALPPGQGVTAAFMNLHNTSDTVRQLIGVDAPFAERAEIHVHSHHQGMMRMRQVPSVTIEPRAAQAFRPGGYHIMIFGVQGLLKPGDNLPLELQFANGDTLRVKATVRSVLDE